MSRRLVIALAVVAILLAALISYYTVMMFSKPSRELIVFCAGSLKVPLTRLARMFEEKYHVRVYIEASGSVDAVRKIIDLGRRCDVLALADYRLVPMYMFPKYASWVLKFAANRIVLAYTSHSKYHEELELGRLKWYQVLMMPGVRYGFSNPNRDPCGYRSIGVLALASMYYGNRSILERLVEHNLQGVRVVYEDNGTIIVYVSASITPRDGLVIRPKSVALLSLLESGVLDYAFEYESVAKQHGLKYVVLPDEVNLGDPSKASFYSRVIVYINVGTPEERAIRMAPIVYGLTIPSNAPHPKLAREFILFLLHEGPRVFSECGQRFLNPPEVVGSAPSWLKEALSRG